jgi:hypothetical protein
MRALNASVNKGVGGRMATRRRSSSKSKTVAQQVVGTAAMGMPSPVKGVVATRWGARITLVVVGLALATGVLTVKWDGYVPHFQLDKQRAKEVSAEVRDKVEDVAHKVEGEKHTGFHPPKITR